MLNEPLSNSACFSSAEDYIIILGGGFNHGFSLDSKMLNIRTNEWT